MTEGVIIGFSSTTNFDDQKFFPKLQIGSKAFVVQGHHIVPQSVANDSRLLTDLRDTGLFNWKSFELNGVALPSGKGVDLGLAAPLAGTTLGATKHNTNHAAFNDALRYIFQRLDKQYQLIDDSNARLQYRIETAGYIKGLTQELKAGFVDPKSGAVLQRNDLTKTFNGDLLTNPKGYWALFKDQIDPVTGYPKPGSDLANSPIIRQNGFFKVPDIWGDQLDNFDLSKSSAPNIDGFSLRVLSAEERVKFALDASNARLSVQFNNVATDIDIDDVDRMVAVGETMRKLEAAGKHFGNVLKPLDLTQKAIDLEKAARHLSNGETDEARAILLRLGGEEAGAAVGRIGGSVLFLAVVGIVAPEPTTTAAGVIVVGAFVSQVVGSALGAKVGGDFGEFLAARLADRADGNPISTDELVAAYTEFVEGSVRTLPGVDGELEFFRADVPQHLLDAYRAEIRDGLSGPASRQIEAFRAEPKCFAAGTPILLADWSTKPIEQIKVGDQVLAFDQEQDDGRGGLVPRRVVRTFVGTTDEWILLSGPDNFAVTVTPGHKFLSSKGDFREISELLAEGDGAATVILEGGDEAVVQGRRVTAGAFGSIGSNDGLARRIPHVGEPTYNFEVEGLHTYVAGSVRVHNDSIQAHVPFDRGAQIAQYYNSDHVVYEMPDGALVEIVGSDLNGDERTDLLSREVTYQNSHAKVVQDIQLDGYGNIEDIEFKEFSISGVPFGEIVGTALGRHAASVIEIDNFIVDLGVDALVSTLVENLGEFVHAAVINATLGELTFNGESLLEVLSGVVDGVVNHGDKLADAFSAEFSSFVQGALASAAVYELIEAIELDGIAGEVVGTLAGRATDQLIANTFDVVFDGASFETLGDGFNLEALFPDPSAIIARLAASNLAGELITPESQEAAVLGSIGSSIGAYFGGTAGNLFGIVSWAGGPLGAAIGLFIGQVAGTLLGNLFGGQDDPYASATITLSPGGREYGVGGFKTDDGGSANIAESLALAASNGVNSIIEMTGGIMRRTSSYDLKIGYEGDTYFVVLNGDRRNFDNSGEAIKFAALKLLKGADIVGGHAILMRAWHNSKANTLEAFQQDLIIAEAFQTYLLNPTGVIALMLEQPESAAAQQWAFVLQRAEEMELHLPHEKDFDGGWGELLAARGDVNPEAIPDIDGTSITMTDPITGEVITIQHAIGPGYEIVRTETTDGSDTIQLTLNADQISYTNAGPGDDSFVGHDGVDVFIGGDGDDTASGGPGNDWLLGNAGNDSLIGEAGDDLLVGHEGDDTLEGGDGYDLAYGGAGNDLIMGNGHTDFLYGGTGDDEVHGNDGRADKLWGGEGNDSLYLQDGDYGYGGLGNDHFFGGAGTNTIHIDRLDGHDTVWREPGGGFARLQFSGDISFNELFFERLGSDLKISIIGHNQSVTVDDHFAGKPAKIYSNSGELALNKAGGWVATTQALVDAHAALPETVSGSENLISNSALSQFNQFPTGTTSFYYRNTQVVYNTHYFTKNFSAENFWGNPNFRSQGNDNYQYRNATSWVKYQVYGGAGNDHLYPSTYSNLGTSFRLFGDSGHDILKDTHRAGYLSGGTGNDKLYGNGGDDKHYGGAGDDYVSAGSGDDQVYGGSGVDRLFGEAGDDQIWGGAGGDFVWGQDGDDFVDGGDGNDWIGTHAGSDTVHGGDGDDTLYPGSGDDFVYGGSGNDTILGLEGADLLSGEEGDDTIDGGFGDDTLNGGEGNDTLFGADGLDLVVGGAGDDTIIGGSGADSLAGGTGADLFVYGSIEDSRFSSLGAGDPAMASTLLKIGGGGTWDSDAVSTESFTGAGTVTTTAVQTDASAMVGLSSNPGHSDPKYMSFGILLSSNADIRIFESGTKIATYDSYEIGDRFSVERTADGRIEYLKNGEVFHQSVSTVSLTDPLFADAAVYAVGGAIGETFLSDADGNQTPVRWNADPQYRVGDWGGNLEASYVDINLDGRPDALISGPTGFVGARLAAETGDFGDLLIHAPLLEASTLRKVDGLETWNSSASSLQAQSGVIRFDTVVSDLSTKALIGLSRPEPDPNHTAIDYAFHTNGAGELRVYESYDNAYKGPVWHYEVGDQLSIERTADGQIRYLKNDVVLFTSAVTVGSDTALMADVAIKSISGSIGPSTFAVQDGAASPVHWVVANDAIRAGNWSFPQTVSYVHANEDSIPDIAIRDVVGFHAVAFGDGDGQFSQWVYLNPATEQFFTPIDGNLSDADVQLGPVADRADIIFDYDLAEDVIDLTQLEVTRAQLNLEEVNDALLLTAENTEFALWIDEKQHSAVSVLLSDGIEEIAVTSPVSDDAENDVWADLTGDGESDIPWFNTVTRQVGYYDMEDGAYTWERLGIAGENYQVAGIGDFTGDGEDDILWFNAVTRRVGYYDMEDGTYSWEPRGFAGENYEVAGVGDFTGDGEDDILWFNTATRQVGFYDFEGGSYTWERRGVAGPNYEVAGVGDFTGDGEDDILWFNTATRQVGFYDFEGGSYTWERQGVAGPDYQVAGVGDFTGDGEDDILWFNAVTRRVGYYDMEGGSYSWDPLGFAGPDYQVAGVGDFTGDGEDDILWFNAVTRRVGYYDMEDGSYSWDPLGFAGENYHIVG